MLIVPLVENKKSDNNILKNEKGLSLYIETEKKKIIFDLGATDIFKQNANQLKIKLKDIDYFIVSHGHGDHMGGLNFLEDSEKRKIFLHKLVKSKFTFSIFGINFNIGNNTQLNIDGVDKKIIEISPTIFLLNTSKKNPSPFYKIDNERDHFNHEYHLIILEDDKINIVTGCCHCGLMVLIDEVKNSFPNKSINSLTGGIHTRNFVLNFISIIKIIFMLRTEKIKHINLGHCTGIITIKILKFFTNLNELNLSKEIQTKG